MMVEEPNWIIGIGCTGCSECTRVCPADCIVGSKGHVHVIDQKRCLHCGACAEACPVGCIKLDD